MNDIEQKYDYMLTNLKELDSDGWALDKEQDRISVKYKFPPDTPSVSILMESTIPVAAIKLLALVNEIELYPKYIPFCRKAYMVK